MVFVNVYGETFEELDRNIRVERNNKIIKDIGKGFDRLENLFCNVNSELIAVQNKMEAVDNEMYKVDNLMLNIKNSISSYEGLRKQRQRKF